MRVHTLVLVLGSLLASQGRAALPAPGAPAGAPDSVPFWSAQSPVLAVQAEGPEYVSAQVGNVTLWHPATIVDGQLLIVEIAPAPGCDTPVVVWQGQSYKTLPVGEHVRALMPVALGTSPGQKDLQVICGTETARFPLLVTAGNYPESQLTVDPKFVHAPPERATVEGANIHQALSQSDPVPFWREAFLRPTDGVITSIFGGRRTFNVTLASRHMGLDFDGSLGTPVRAANRGRVVLAAGDYYFVGNAVFVDHGAGLFTMYFHMSALAVKTGDMVEKGQLIGEIGSTGRATGPHLHFGTKIQGIYFNPEGLLDYEPAWVLAPRTVAPMCRRGSR